MINHHFTLSSRSIWLTLVRSFLLICFLFQLSSSINELGGLLESHLISGEHVRPPEHGSLRTSSNNESQQSHSTHSAERWSSTISSHVFLALSYAILLDGGKIFLQAVLHGIVTRALARFGLSSPMAYQRHIVSPNERSKCDKQVLI
jgi:hypothetical protein